jgi:hypothetical protein
VCVRVFGVWFLGSRVMCVCACECLRGYTLACERERERERERVRERERESERASERESVCVSMCVCVGVCVCAIRWPRCYSIPIASASSTLSLPL